ncbi:M20/M25/M40 family metallo-hydrolase [Algoriphagus zhangzhouensis]|uniref:Putative aminopeptidase FrvX n=1 Tax=Algoriphagus zhangzhouensis TaxID=1073327 RepID=A0A1M7ZID1_9BACT|nr:M20/M25/M40 family metallo-hydrolase [Algoriphagus zhangzhouensis]TDY43790.1 putative aminopeptidase FrvX [Algoriphagus zhangzhouensis]SHO64665.1 Putative aminopeptidase FrvX [Algoriphagus zhangzhouensis]
MKLLRDLLVQFGVSGDEGLTTKFILQYIYKQKKNWSFQPEIFAGDEFHDCILLKFGSPTTAVFAHIDTIGFMSRYENQLVAVGGPEIQEGTLLEGQDSLGQISCRILGDEDNLRHDFGRAIERGTRLAFAQDIRIDDEFIQAAYLDNRLGVYSALKVCENLEHGWVVFSTYEEHGGGSMPYLLSFIQQKHPIKNALISDITWVTDGVFPNEGVVISIRDKFIPRKKFIDKVVGLAKESGIPFQLEVEAYGGSDGREVQFSPYAIDWVFVGAAEENVHTPNEKVALSDLDSMIQMHQYLMKHL